MLRILVYPGNLSDQFKATLLDRDTTQRYFDYGGTRFYVDGPDTRPYTTLPHLGSPLADIEELATGQVALQDLLRPHDVRALPGLYEGELMDPGFRGAYGNAEVTGRYTGGQTGIFVTGPVFYFGNVVNLYKEMARGGLSPTTPHLA